MVLPALPMPLEPERVPAAPVFWPCPPLRLARHE
jgi:hypothetical protein